MEFYIALLLINIIGIYMMFEDKGRAKKQQYRIREKTLWLIAFIGGGVGMTLGMNLFRHKTKHSSFKFGLPLLALLQIILLLYIS